MKHYTYLITNLTPKSAMRYYIGVHKGNPKNDNYMGSSIPLTEDIIALGIENFEKIVISIFDSRIKADEHEKELHITHDVAKNIEFYNKKIGIVGFSVTQESIIKQKNTINNQNWKNTKGKEKNRKQTDTKNSKEWKDTIGKEQSRKMRETKNSKEWKDTVGKTQSEKLSKTRLDPKWKKEVGNNAVEKYKNTVNNPAFAEQLTRRNNNIRKTKNSKEWKDTIGKDTKKKVRKTKSDPDYIKKHTVTCRYCNKRMINSGAFVRYHNNNCNENPNSSRFKGMVT